MLAIPENGRLVFSSVDLDSVASFSCDEGYVLDGSQTRTCTLEGWSDDNPECSESQAVCDVCCVHVCGEGVFFSQLT